ncbi:hypothetical protein PENSPDRAFT_681394 [Peniophora sp. CONT]|nr:hypothetical protein PENSPDRAFT_681394 [Peniophora sp. CONT]
MSYQSSNKFLLVDGVLALTMGPESSQQYHSTLWRLRDPRALSECMAYNGLFIMPADTGIACSAPTISINGKNYRVLDYAHITLGQTSRVLSQGVYRPKCPVSTAAQQEGLAPPIFFTIGGHVGIRLEEAARKRTDVLDQSGFPAPLRNKTTGYLCIHWPGYQIHDAQVELKDSKRQSITFGKLAQRVANFVDTFIGNPQRGAVPDLTSRRDDVWQPWPQANTHIRSCITLLGVAHVSTGHWQVLLSIDEA